MALRSWVGIFALLGVLAHAAAIPRHNAIMLGAALEAAEQQAALAAVGEASATGLMCRAEKGSGAGGSPSTPGKSGSCPICMGVSPAYAVLACHDFVVAVSFAVLLERVVFRDMRMVQLKQYRSPARGPPLA
jgi:hypothetical protein